MAILIPCFNASSGSVRTTSPAVANAVEASPDSQRSTAFSLLFPRPSNPPGDPKPKTRFGIAERLRELAPEDERIAQESAVRPESLLSGRIPYWRRDTAT